jgi:type I restriction enzyme M protein
LTLEHYSGEDLKNKFCNLKNLRGETDVREIFLAPLLDELGFTEDYRETERLPEKNIGKGKKKRSYKPDYVCFADKSHHRPVLIVDAKSPTENAEEGVEDAQLYTAVIRRALDAPKPIQYCIGSNGVRTVVKHYDSDKVELELLFADFKDGNSKFSALLSQFSRETLAKSASGADEPFEFKKPDMTEVTGIFEACHDIIRRRDGLGQEGAFYEFTKVMFVKLNEDKRLREDDEVKAIVKAGRPIPTKKVRFSTSWIRQNESSEPHPVNTILFAQLREKLELEIEEKKKKRIFQKDERIELKPDTVKEIVKLIEHFDLFGIDEDLNGRLFETFLSATMRGEKLGQFFTPRSVVEFMTELADLKANANHIDRVLDGCCGTGGFLIEAMTVMAKQIRKPGTLSDKQTDDLLRDLRDNRLIGIDKGQKPLMAQIARINMYLHEDGGSRIYFADALDKDMAIDETLPAEIKSERRELHELLKKEKFDAVLTNPPFATPKKAKEPDEKAILEKYELAYQEGAKRTRKLKSSLESNVMFLERYHDLLVEGGKLITVIDESVLNTDSDKAARDFVFRNFLIKAIISLPRETFRRAGANVKTSILFLEKKRSPDEGQPVTFYARSYNTGFDPDNAQKLAPNKSDLVSVVLKKWKDFQKSGEI